MRVCKALERTFPSCKTEVCCAECEDRSAILPMDLAPNKLLLELNWWLPSYLACAWMAPIVYVGYLCARLVTTVATLHHSALPCPRIIIVASSRSKGMASSASPSVTDIARCYVLHCRYRTWCQLGQPWLASSDGIKVEWYEPTAFSIINNRS